MKHTFLYLMVLLIACFLASCSTKIQHADSFYNYNDSDFPRDHLPVINPVEATRDRENYTWSMKLLNVLWVDLPKSNDQEVQEVYGYYRIEDLETFAVKDGVIMAYSAYVDEKAAPYILNDFYHWFVMIPSDDITVGFHMEDEFNRYIETMHIQDPDWQTPDDAFDTFLETGCLDWFPDCK